MLFLRTVKIICGYRCYDFFFKLHLIWCIHSSLPLGLCIHSDALMIDMHSFLLLFFFFIFYWLKSFFCCCCKYWIKIPVWNIIIIYLFLFF
ncbi:uncharacterized protein EV154DRAFT_72163 [Mucor mucedo]|uniref:uncharacterized protein n=1 Tax=Mucor mucedo TaxID=29922 RepID=UPI002220DCC5|nr:uncharacterized protein EV154DRAFT_72163 [Mucor mucedo]KAI7894730.1 hypothetical protein EV154DRAFT_72163 [Mucor mucedo]